MKKSALVRYLIEQGCQLKREGKRHEFWINTGDKSGTSTVPRHGEIKDLLAIKICKDLKIPPIK